VIEISTKSAEAREAFDRGEILLVNLRPEEAAKAFDEALSHDPGFALARALRGQATPGADGLKQIETAAGMRPVSEGEQVLIEGMVANRRGDWARAKESFTRVTQLASGDWRGHYMVGVIMMNEENYPGATESLRKAAELNPKAGGAQNMLGYSALRQGDTATAIAAFEEYARVLPTEPNPQDSLGEALLAAGRFKDAETAFAKAAELSPQFGIAWEGIAYARYFGGDTAGARDALAKARQALTRAGDKAQIDSVLAAIEVAENRPAAARRALDAAEKTPDAEPSDIAFVPITRAMMLIDTGNHRESAKEAGVALERADANQYPPGLERNLRREALRARITAEARLGDKTAAAVTSAALDQEASSSAADAAAQTAMHYGRGMLAVAQGELATARSHFEQCSSEDEYCKYQLVLAAQKAGDSAGAAAVRDRIVKLYQRTPGHIVVRARLMQKAGSS
jgi:Flp pilus assembly protein TadD